jgi:hypothetical protein
LVCTYSGTDSSSRKIYIDGIETGADTATDGTGDTTHALNIQTSTFYLNKTNYGGGSLVGQISQFKLYDTALTTGEVKTLYDMGRTGSVANPKTLQIASSLDVRGDIYGGCPVFFHATRTDGHRNSATNPVIFNNVVSSKGGGYDSSTGKFTCPLAGYYKIYCYGITDSGNHLDLRLRINNSDQTFGKAYAWANITNHVQAHATSIVYLNHNDVVHYRLADGSFSGSGTTSNQANANGFIMEYFSS